jgi:hypothetical protein
VLLEVEMVVPNILDEFCAKRENMGFVLLNRDIFAAANKICYRENDPV